MAGESSSTIDNKTASQNADSYISTFLSVTSKTGIRYEGTVCYLNLTDCTLGLKDVKSFGTEGRRANGTDIPPSDRVYQYIMFRGTDIKEMESKAAPPIQVEESIHNDPAIIQARYSSDSSFSSRPLSAGAAYSELPTLNTMSYLSISSPNYSVTQSGIINSSHVTHSAFSTSDTQRGGQEYNHLPSHVAGVHEHSLSSSVELYPSQNQLGTSTELSDSTHNVSPAHFFSASSSINLKTTQDLTPEHHHLPFTSPFSSSLASSSHSNAVNSNGLTPPLPSSHQSTSSVGSPAVSEVAPGPRFSFPTKSSAYTAPSISEQTLQTSNSYSHPKLSDAGTNFSAPAPSVAVQRPLLPLPPPSQKLKYQKQNKSPGLNEEFNFEAMNEKFKKDEIWEDIGKRDKMERIQTHNSSWVRKSDTQQAAYEKDGFFDTISRHSISRNGQNKSSQRIKCNSETFGRCGRGNRGRGRGVHQPR